MSENDADSATILPDLFDMSHEYLFRLIGRKRTCSLEVKCLMLVLILSIPAFVTTFFAGTLPAYLVEGWGHLVASIFMGIFVWLIVRFFSDIDMRIRYVNRIISPVKSSKGKESSQQGTNQNKDTEWGRWNKKIENYRDWCRNKAISINWYYFCAIGGAIVGFVLGMLLIGPDHGWTQGYILPELYLRAWYIFYGFLVGASLQFISVGFWVIRKYCKNVVSKDEILPLDPDRTGGLRELGRISLDLDFIVAIPSAAFPIAVLLFRHSEFLGHDIGKNVEVGIALAILYALLLVVVFFISISPAHNAMVNAKTSYLLRIHGEYKDMHKALLKKLKPKELIAKHEYERLLNLYKLYDRVENMAVWPLDFRTVARFVITSILPLLSVGITFSLTL